MTTNSIFATKSISKTITEVLLLFVIGFFAAFLHAKLRIPLKMPGHHGLEFMLIIMSGRTLSKLGAASTLSSLGASAFFLMPFAGIKDPIMPIAILLPGIMIDLFYYVTPKIKTSVVFIGLLAGIAYAMIPMVRFIFSLTTGYVYTNMAGGLAYPLISHFIWGTAGGMLAYGIIKVVKK
ncbi:MAG: hypothetical protein CVU05_00430 [Bacteroidetes bacterium HGW-Bacteroidetes-21]|jgi:hypothetical protein|nr:MAG: hypothetical protein CVU05_00430 [Bacteroidetes bacterium HGW-Bacteroidetes-21]